MITKVELKVQDVQFRGYKSKMLKNQCRKSIQLYVMSRSDAIYYSTMAQPEDSVIVSLSTVGDNKPNFRNNSDNRITYALYLAVNDVESPFEHAYSDEDAKKVAKFLLDTALNPSSSTKRIIFHCDAGQSRSAGVCAGVLQAIIGDDRQIYSNVLLKPNTTCKIKTREALLDVITERFGN